MDADESTFQWVVIVSPTDLNATGVSNNQVVASRTGGQHPTTNMSIVAFSAPKSYSHLEVRSFSVMSRVWSFSSLNPQCAEYVLKDELGIGLDMSVPFTPDLRHP